MILEVDFVNASVSALIPISITGIVVGIYKVAEFNQHKKSVETWMEDATTKMDKHESNDENRQLEVIRRMEKMEENLMDNWKELIKK